MTEDAGRCIRCQVKQMGVFTVTRVTILQSINDSKETEITEKRQ